MNLRQRNCDARLTPHVKATCVLCPRDGGVKNSYAATATGMLTAKKNLMALLFKHMESDPKAY